jgi:hypothetical protein
MKNETFLFAASLVFTLLLLLGGNILLPFLLFFFCAFLMIFRLLKKRSAHTAKIFAVLLAVCFGAALCLVQKFGVADRFFVFDGRECGVSGYVTKAPVKTETGFQYEVSFHTLSCGKIRFNRSARALLYSKEDLGLSAFDSFAGSAK